MKYKKITSFPRNEENPFIEDIMEITISKRRKIISGKKPSLIVDGEGEVLGEQVFAVLEKVDKASFTKVFKKGWLGLFDLSKAAIKVFSYITIASKPNKDTVFFDAKECKEHTGYKTHQPINTGLAELIEKDFIARTDKSYLYYINPTMFFNGSRAKLIHAYEFTDDTNSKIEPNKTGLLD